ncbi:MAG: hypothetical protein LBF13_02840 [Campylobacteraceae bacterium]|nr:hypothetical protein [Campylobacteraceae bacterium]
MKLCKTMIVASLLIIACSIPANAWGKKEQGFLLGAATALTLPYLISNHRYHEPVKHYGGHHRYAPNTVYTHTNAPTIIYIENVQNDDNIPPHRRVKSHHYINNQQADRKVIIINQ